MARTVRVRLELDRTDYKQGLRDAANDTRAFDAEVTKLGGSAGRTGAQLKDTDTAAKKLGDDVKQSGRDTRNLASDLDTTRASLRGLGDEYKRTGSVELDRYRSLTSELRKLEKAKQDLDKLVPNKSGGFLSSLTAKLPSISADAGKVFSGGFFGTLGNIASSPAGFGLLVGSAALVASSLGAIISGGILAGIGAGGIAAGIASQVDDPRVKAGFSALVAWAKDQLNQVTSGFAPAIAAGLGALQREAQPFFASLRQPFADLAPVVATLLAKLGEGLAKLGPGLAHALEAAGPILERIALDLPALFRSLGGLFDTLARHGKEAGEAIDMVFRLIDFTIGQVAASLAVLTSMFGAMVRAADFLTGILAKIPVVGELWKPLHSYVDGIAHSMDGLGESAASAMGPMQGLVVGLSRLGAQVDASDFQKLSQQISATGQTTDVLAGQITDHLVNGMLSLDQASLGMNQALLQVHDSFVQNGTQLDIMTAKGQANTSAILGAVSANLRQYDALIQSGVGAQDAAAAYDQNTAALEHQLRQAGLTQQQIDGLIGKYKQVPNEVDTTIAMKGIQAAIDDLIAVQLRINGLHDREIDITVTTTYVENRQSVFNQQVPAAARQRYGGTVAYAAGGLVDYKARSGILAPSSPGTILAAEPQTGGEVFTPRLGISNERGLALANVAARWHGGHVMAGSPSQRPSSAAQGYVDNRNVTYVINDAADPQKVVAAIKEYERNNGKGWRDR